MEIIQLYYPATTEFTGKALAGVVGSGDLEAIFEPETQSDLMVKITTSVDGSKLRWQNLFNRLNEQIKLPAGKLEINDFGATPGVARLRIEQVFEEASNAK